MKSGFIGLVGRPNVGKSTLINSIVGKKIAITSNKPQTTRNIIQGIYNDSDSQMIFVDTPGIHKPNHKLGKVLNKQAYYSINDVDIILFLVDGSQSIGAGDKYIIEKLKTRPVMNKIINILNGKIEKIEKFNLPIEKSLRNILLIKKLKNNPKGYPRNYSKIKKG